MNSPQEEQALPAACVAARGEAGCMHIHQPEGQTSHFAQPSGNADVALDEASCMHMRLMKEQGSLYERP